MANSANNGQFIENLDEFYRDELSLPWDEDPIAFLSGDERGNWRIYRGDLGLYRYVIGGVRVQTQVDAVALVEKKLAVQLPLTLTKAWDGACIRLCAHDVIRNICDDGEEEDRTYIAVNSAGRFRKVNKYWLVKNELAIIDGDGFYKPFADKLPKIDYSKSSTPWESDKIFFVPKEGYEVLKSSREGLYRIIGPSLVINRNAAYLLGNNLAVTKDEYLKRYSAKLIEAMSMSDNESIKKDDFVKSFTQYFKDNFPEYYKANPFKFMSLRQLIAYYDRAVHASGKPVEATKPKKVEESKKVEPPKPVAPPKPPKPVEEVFPKDELDRMLASVTAGYGAVDEKIRAFEASKRVTETRLSEAEGEKVRDCESRREMWFSRAPAIQTSFEKLLDYLAGGMFDINDDLLQKGKTIVNDYAPILTGLKRQKTMLQKTVNDLKEFDVSSLRTQLINKLVVRATHFGRKGVDYVTKADEVRSWIRKITDCKNEGNRLLERLTNAIARLEPIINGLKTRVEFVEVAVKVNAMLLSLSSATSRKAKTGMFAKMGAPGSYKLKLPGYERKRWDFEIRPISKEAAEAHIQAKRGTSWYQSTTYYQVKDNIKTYGCFTAKTLCMFGILKAK